MDRFQRFRSDENAGEVYVVRNGNFAGRAVNYPVTLDSKEILAIGINEYAKFKVEKGEHEIGVICEAGWTFSGTHVNEKPATIEPGKSYYFMARGGGVCAVIEPLTEEVGRA